MLGVLNKNGTPKFSKEYLQLIIPDENLHNLGYLGFVVLLSNVSFVAYTPLILYALIVVSDAGANYMRQNPNIGIPNIMKENMMKVANNKGQYLALKAELEIYVGFYLIFGWFFGMSTIISTVFYWQFMRIKYMISSNTQLAFSQMRMKIDTIMTNPSIPGILKQGWGKVKSALNWMVSIEQPGQSPSM